jgi:cellulose synthase/poly-beta-1,6-N-acetylglucosamine synthase-like glycosyltransferase
MTNISIIIPSYNSEKTIEHCLNSIFNQKTDLKYEVIVVDSSPNNLVDNIVKKHPKIKFIKEEEKTFSGIARNIGAKKAKGELLAFIDSDIIISKNWINRTFKYYKHRHDIFIGSIDIWKNNSNFFKKLEWFFVCSELKSLMKEGFRWCLAGCALCVKKELFDKNNFLNMQTSQDSEFTIRLNKKGNNLYFNPKLRVSHIFQTTFSKLIKKAFTFGTSNGQLRKLHNISGSATIKNKILGFFAIPFFALFKFTKVSWRNVRYNNLFDKFLYILMIPLVILLVISWMLGFYKCLFAYKNKITLTKS